MSRDGSFTDPWADGTYQFRLAWGELIMLQEACDAGPFIIAQWLGTGSWRVEHISHIIRLGLIGGGMEPVPALKLVEAYVEKRPPMENLDMAAKILGCGLYGADDEDVGGGTKKKRVTKKKDSRRSQTAKSG